MIIIAKGKYSKNQTGLKNFKPKKENEDMYILKMTESTCNHRIIFYIYNPVDKLLFWGSLLLRSKTSYLYCAHKFICNIKV